MYQPMGADQHDRADVHTQSGGLRSSHPAGTRFKKIKLRFRAQSCVVATTQDAVRDTIIPRRSRFEFDLGLLSLQVARLKDREGQFLSYS